MDEVTITINTMKNIYTTIAALLLVLCACWNIKCESDKRAAIERQAQFQQYLHFNSKPYKQSLKQDSIFAQRLDISPLSIVHSKKERWTIDKMNKITNHKPYMPK